MLFKVILAFVFVICSDLLFAQYTESDSLAHMVKLRPSDTVKVSLLNRLVTSLREKDNNRALPFAHEASELAALLNDRRGLSRALENLGWIYYRKGNYSKSLETSTRALRISEEIQDKALMAKCQVNIAAIYYEQKQYVQAIASFRKAYNIAMEINDQPLKARCYNNIAYTFLGCNAIDSAYFHVHRALKLSEVAGDPYLIAFARRTLGDIKLLKKNVPEALAHFNECHRLSVLHKNTFIKASVLHRLAKAYVQQGNFEKALNHLSENLTVAKQYGFEDELERAYKMLAEIYYKKNDLKRAYMYQTAYINLHDSLYNQRSSEQIAIMQTRYDTEIKQAQIELLTKDAALQNEEINQQRVWIYFYVGCLSLLVILAFVLLYNNRYASKARQALEEKNKAIEIQTRQLENLNATKDKLFSIISHDLRSPVASLRALMEIVTKVGLSQEEFVDVTTSLKSNLDSVYEDLDNLLFWAQTQLNGLQAFPEEFDLRQLADDKISLFKDLARIKKITIVNGIPDDTFVLADRNHVSLIFRNLLANAVKFNQPGGLITISASEKANYYEIEVMDSGVGISCEDINKLFNAETHFTKPGTHKEKGVGIGLLLTKEFVESNHGSIWVNSQLGKGTTFTFTLKTSKQAVLV